MADKDPGSALTAEEISAPRRTRFPGLGPIGVPPTSLDPSPTQQYLSAKESAISRLAPAVTGGPAAPVSLFKPNATSIVNDSLQGFLAGIRGSADAKERAGSSTQRDRQLELQDKQIEAGKESTRIMADVENAKIQDTEKARREIRVQEANTYARTWIEKNPELARKAAEAGIPIFSGLKRFAMGELDDNEMMGFLGSLESALNDASFGPNFAQSFLSRKELARLDKGEALTDDEVNKIRRDTLQDWIKTAGDPLKAAELATRDADKRMAAMDAQIEKDFAQADLARAQGANLSADTKNRLEETLNKGVADAAKDQADAAGQATAMIATLLRGSSSGQNPEAVFAAMMGLGEDDRERALQTLTTPGNKESERYAGVLRGALLRLDRATTRAEAYRARLDDSLEITPVARESKETSDYPITDEVFPKPPEGGGDSPFAPIPDPLKGGDYKAPSGSPIGGFISFFSEPVIDALSTASDWLGGDRPGQKIARSESIVDAAMENDRALAYLAENMDRFPDPTNEFASNKAWEEMPVTARIEALKGLRTASGDAYFKSWLMLTNLGIDNYSRWKTGKITGANREVTSPGTGFGPATGEPLPVKR